MEVQQISSTAVNMDEKAKKSSAKAKQLSELALMVHMFFKHVDLTASDLIAGCMLLTIQQRVEKNK
jgi:hypothetical protein